MKTKKTIALLLTVASVFTTTSTSFANVNDVPKVSIEQVEDNGIQSFAVSTSKKISLKAGKNWSTSFTMAKAGEDHNAFKAIVSGVMGGTYKLMIQGANGYNYITDELTGDVNMTVTNTASGVKYTVTVVNTGLATLTGTVKVSSYYHD